MDKHYYNREKIFRDEFEIETNYPNEITDKVLDYLFSRYDSLVKYSIDNEVSLNYEGYSFVLRSPENLRNQNVSKQEEKIWKML